MVNYCYTKFTKGWLKMSQVQISMIRQSLEQNFPNIPFNVEEPSGENVISVVWDNPITEYEVMKAIGHLSSAYNTTDIERETFTKSIRIHSGYVLERGEATQQLKEQLILAMRSNPRLSRTIIGRELNEDNLSSMENISIMTGITKYRHLLTDNLENFRLRFPNEATLLADKTRTIIDSSQDSLEVKDAFITSVEDDRFKNVLKGLRDVFANTYLADGFPQVLDNILSRKYNLLKSGFKVDFGTANLEILGNLTKKHGHSGKIEEIFSKVSMSDLEQPLFGIPEESPNYQEVLINSLESELLGLTGLDKILFDNVGDKKQTINTLQGFNGFEQFPYRDSVFIKKELNQNKLLMSDDYIIVQVDNYITVKPSKSLNEKIEITTLFV